MVWRASRRKKCSRGDEWDEGWQDEEEFSEAFALVGSLELSLRGFSSWWTSDHQNYFLLSWGRKQINLVLTEPNAVCLSDVSKQGWLALYIKDCRKGGNAEKNIDWEVTS